MKKLLCLLMMVGLVMSASAKTLSSVEGVWERKVQGNLPSKITLFEVRDGQLAEVASAKPNAEGRFSMKFPVETEGYYALALNKSMVSRYVFYLKPGDKLGVRVTRNSYVLEGENTQENIEMTKWHDFILPIERKAAYGEGSTFVDFFPQLEEKNAEFAKYKKAKTKNKVFNRSFEDFKKFNFLDNAIIFVHTMRKAHPHEDDYIDYYRNLNMKKYFKSDAYLNYPYSLDLLIKAQIVYRRLQGTFHNDHLKLMLIDDPKLIANERIKGDIMLMFAGNYKSLASLQEFRDQYGHFAVTDSQKKRLDSYEKKLIDEINNRKPATDFTYQDVDGNKVSLSDFKGKVVYIDVWATWCGPCKSEIPHLKKLEKEYHDNPNVVFMSVSVDNDKAYERWKQFIAENEMEGVQLYTGTDSEVISEAYAIRGIPRFILVDKKGNLVASDAVRPSSGKEIRSILDAELNR